MSPQGWQDLWFVVGIIVFTAKQPHEALCSCGASKGGDEQ